MQIDNFIQYCEQNFKIDDNETHEFINEKTQFFVQFSNENTTSSIMRNDFKNVNETNAHNIKYKKRRNDDVAENKRNKRFCEIQIDSFNKKYETFRHDDQHQHR